MLISFRMRNFKSFRNETFLSTETSDNVEKDKLDNTILCGKKRVLKSLLIFGPDGSGKSNLLQGLKIMQSMVLVRMPDQYQPLNINKFRLAPANDDQDTYFEVTITVDERTYKYAFSFNAKKITYESLSAQTATCNQVYFERTDTKFNAEDPNWEDLFYRTNPNGLLLHLASVRAVPAARAVVNWFANDLIIFGDFETTPAISKLISSVKDDKFKPTLKSYLGIARAHIDGVRTIEKPSPLSWEKHHPINTQVPATMHQLLLEHPVYKNDNQVVGHKWLSLADESRDIQKMALIMLATFSSEQGIADKTLLFDDIDYSLSPLAVGSIISVINSETNRNQFILTTTEPELWDDTFLDDQVLLVDKNFKGESSLKLVDALNDAKELFPEDANYMHKYLNQYLKIARLGYLPSSDNPESTNTPANVSPGETDED